MVVDSERRRWAEPEDHKVFMSLRERCRHIVEWSSLALRHGIGFIGLHFVMATSPKRRARGFEVVLVYDTPDDDEVVAKVAEAFGLIEAHDPVRFRRLRRDLARVLVTKAGGPQYLAPVRACLLNTGMILGTSPAALALMLVHEGTHARLWGPASGTSPKSAGGLSVSACSQSWRWPSDCRTRSTSFSASEKTWRVRGGGTTRQ